MAINVASLYDMTRPGLRGIEGKYKQIPTQWSQYMDRGTSKMGVERTLEARYVGLPALRTEGGATQFDNQAGERFIYNHEHFEVALGYAITLKAIEDNLYEQEFPASNLGLQTSFAQAKEIFAANVLNTGFTVNSNIGGDGVALFSTAHPIDGGTWANTPTTQLDLNEATLLTALTQIRVNFRDQAGMKALARGEQLMVPPALQWVGKRLVEAERRPGTADNDPNVIELPKGLLVLDFLTSAFAWFVRTNVPGLLYLERAAFEMSMDVDFVTDNLLVKGRERYFVGYKNPRCAWATNPTS